MDVSDMKNNANTADVLISIWYVDKPMNIDAENKIHDRFVFSKSKPEHKYIMDSGKNIVMLSYWYDIFCNKYGDNINGIKIIKDE